MQTTSNKNMSTEHSEWKNALGFYKDELTIFKNRLIEVASKNTSLEIAKEVEHFQNQFLIQHENIDILHHDINEHLKTISHEMQTHAGHVTHEQLDLHQALSTRFETEQKIFKELKDSYMDFLSKVM